MSNTLRTSTESKHDPLLARLMRWRPVSLSKQAKNGMLALVLRAMREQPFHQLETLLPNIR
jgi:hypothetical protein